MSFRKSLINPYGPSDFVAFKTACSLASSSCESEVVKILPPRPCSSSSTRTYIIIAKTSRHSFSLSNTFQQLADSLSSVVLNQVLKDHFRNRLTQLPPILIVMGKLQSAMPLESAPNGAGLSAHLQKGSFYRSEK